MAALFSPARCRSIKVVPPASWAVSGFSPRSAVRCWEHQAAQHMIELCSESLRGVATACRKRLRPNSTRPLLAVPNREIVAAAAVPTRSTAKATEGVTPLDRPSRFVVRAEQEKIVEEYCRVGKVKDTIRPSITMEHAKGAMWHLPDYRKHNGKIFAADTALTLPEDATPFPAMKVWDLEGKELNTKDVLKGKLTFVWVALCGKGKVFRDAWANCYFKATGLTEGRPPGDYREEFIHLEVLPQFVFRMGFFRNWLLKDMRKAVKVGQQPAMYNSQLIHQGNQSHPFAKELFISNQFCGYGYLVDHYGKVRWATSGEALPEELARFEKFVKTLHKQVPPRPPAKAAQA